jgi:hypothetical protein
MSLPAPRRWALPPLSVGEFAPDFCAPARINPKFHVRTAAGRYILLAFVPEAAEGAALAAFAQVRGRFDDDNVCAFFVTPRGDFADTPPDITPGLRWFLDPEGEVRSLFGADAGWLLLDPLFRIMARAPLDAPEAVLAQVAGLGSASDYAGPSLVAPVLIVPRVFEPEFCRRLIAYYDAEGGTPSGVMRDIDGRTVGVMDGMKKRRDVIVGDEELKAGISHGLQQNLHRLDKGPALVLDSYR